MPSIQFIKASDIKDGAEALALQISSALKGGRKVLWLVCGGSNIPAAVRAMDMVRKNVDEATLPDLTVAQTDERYGVPGHADSNWSQLLDTGFNVNKVNTIPVLAGKSLKATVDDYAAKIGTAFEEASGTGGLIVALFGIGADGHIAGILPGSPALADPGYASGYEAGSFIRITMTPPAIRKIHSAYALAFGPSKKIPLTNLKNRIEKIEKEPAQILKELPMAMVYSDQF